MSDRDIAKIDSLLETYKPELCLEWGSGNSTIYFPKMHDCIKRWVSIEKSKKWFGHVWRYMKKSVVDLKLRTSVNYLDIDGKYDFILIDGERRNECLELAQKLLTVTGFVLLHDSERDDYNEGIALYGDKKKVLCRGDTLEEGKKNGLMKLWI